MATLLTHQQRIETIRFLLGDVSTSTISDTAIDYFVTQEEEYYGTGIDGQCYVLYNALLKCLLWLVNKNVSSTGGAVTGGAITKVREKMGSIEKEINYSSSSADSSTATSTWKDLYDLYKTNPELVCKSLKRNLSNLIHVGGVSVSEKYEIYSDPDTFGAGYAENQDAVDYDSYLDQQSDPYYFPTINSDDQ